MTPNTHKGILILGLVVGLAGCDGANPSATADTAIC
jgi:hypothetical protein